MQDSKLIDEVIENLRRQFRVEVNSGTDGKTYMLFEHQNISYGIPLSSKRVTDALPFMVKMCHERHINQLQVKELVHMLAGSNMFSSNNSIDIFRRVAASDDNIAILLDNKKGLVANINKKEVKVKNESQFIFHYSGTAEPLPRPLKFVNPTLALTSFRKLTGLSKSHFVNLIVNSLLALTSTGPFPVVEITGDPDLASLLGFMIKSLIDPEKGHTRSIPLRESELVAAMVNAHTIVYNATSASAKILDAICRHAEGCAATKSLGYADDDEAVLWASRFFVLIGDVNLAHSNGLAHRLVVLEAGGDKKLQRMRVGEIRDHFEKLRPFLLGMLCNAVSYGLKNIKDYKIDELQNVPDNVALAIACTGYFKWSLKFVLRSLEENKREALFKYADSDIVVPTAVSLLSNKKSIHCPATELLEIMEAHLKDTNNSIALQSLPANAAALGKRLKNAKEALMVYGIEYVPSHPHGPRMILLRKIDG